MLLSLKDKKAYQVPSGYFEGLAAQVMALVKNQPSRAKLVPVSKRINWLRYAAAAVVIGVISITGFQFLNNNRYYADPIKSLSKLSDEEMIGYLEEQSTPPVSAEASNSVASVDINENDAKDLLSDIPDEDLQQYVQDQAPASSKDLITN